MPEYFVLNLRTNLPIRNASDETITYGTGKEAAAAAAAFSDVTGDKCQPRPFQLDENWQFREQLRLVNGEYQPLPWDYLAQYQIAEYWDDKNKYPITVLKASNFNDYSYQMRHNWFYSRRSKEAQWNFPHVSKLRKGNIAFTESADRGARNIKTSIRPGRYLERFYNLPRSETRRFANDFMVAYGEMVLKFATTIEDIDFVFEHDRGPNSCMTYTLDQYINGYLPARVYACPGSDLQVAYIAVLDDEDKPYRVSARVVVWPEKKVYGRVYGEIQKIEPLLLAQGYKAGWFYGAKLPKIPSGDRGAWYMPYLDGACGLQDNGDHWVICDQTNDKCDAIAQSTSGTIELGAGCDYCSEIRRSLTHIVDVSEHWCARCRQDHAFYCGACGEYYSNEDTSAFDMQDVEQMYCEHCYNRYGGWCDASNSYWTTSELVELWDGRKWNREYFRENGIRCKTCKLNMPLEAKCEDTNSCVRAMVQTATR
jgi:hypothetical protein